MSSKSGIKAPSRTSEPAKRPSSRNGGDAMSRSSSVSTLASVAEGKELKDFAKIASQFAVDDKVWVNGTKPGVVRYLGETQFAPGIWAGIRLDEAEGKNDGSVGGVRYFDCEAQQGIFIRPHRLTREAGTPPSLGDTSPMQPPTQKFPSKPSSTSPVSTPLKSGAKFKCGERVMVNSASGSKTGILRFLGATDFAAGEWAGIELDEPIGKNDGSVGGKRYFECPMNHGLFAPLHKISKPGRSPGLRGTTHSCSLTNRTFSRESLNSSVSSVTSSCAGNRVKLGITSLSNKKPKSTSSFTSPNALQVALKEKEEHIEQLLKERDLDRIEMAQSTVQLQQDKATFLKVEEEYKARIQKYEATIAQLKEVCDKTQLEAKTALALLEEHKRKVEDLQFRLEEETIMKGELEAQTNKEKDKITELEKLLSNEDANKELVSKLSNLESTLQEKEELVTKLQVELADVNVQASVKEEKMKQLITNLEEAENRSNSLKSDGEDSSKAFQTKVVLLEEENSNLKTDQGKYLSKITSLEELVKENEDKCINLNSVIHELKEDAQAKTNEISNLGKLLEVERVEKTKSEEKLREITALQINEKESQKKLSDMSSEINVLSEKLASKEVQLQEKETEAKSLAKTVEEKGTEILQLNQSLLETKQTYNGEVIMNKTQLQNLEEKIAILEKERKELEGKLNEKEASNEKELQRLNSQLKEQIDSKVALESMITNLTNDLNKKMQANEKLTAEMNELNEEISALSKDKSENVVLLQNKINNMKKESERSQIEFELVLKKSFEEKEQLSKLLGEHTELSLQNAASEANLKESLSDKHKRILELESNLEAAKTNSETVAQSLILLQNEFSSLKDENDKSFKEKDESFRKLGEEKEKLAKLLDEQTEYSLQNASSEASLKDTLMERSKRIIELESDLEKAKTNVENLSQNLVANQEEMNILMCKSETSLREKEELLQKLQALNEEIANHAEELIDKNEENAKKKDEVESLKESILAKEEQILKLAELVNDNQNNLKMLKQHNEQSLDLIKKETISYQQEQEKIHSEKEKVLSTEIKKLQSQWNEKDSAVKLLSAEVEMLNGQLNEKEVALKSGEKTMGEFQLESATKDKMILELKQLLQTKEQALSSNEERERAILSEHESKFETLKCQCVNLQKERDEIAQKERTANEDRRDLEKLRDNLINDKMEQIALVQDRDTKLKSLQDEVERMRLEFAKHKTELQGKLDISQMEVETMKEFKKEMELQHGVLQELQQQLQESEKECTRLQNDVKNMNVITKEKVKYEKMYIELQEELLTTVDRVTTVGEVNKKLENSLRESEKKLNEKESEIEILKDVAQGTDTKELITLKDQVRTLEQEKCALTTEVSSLKSQKDNKTEAATKILKKDTDDEDQESLLSQINFLNSIIVDLQKENQDLKTKNQENLNESLDMDINFNGVRQITPRVFCDICDMFDLHDTDDCPAQSSFLQEETSHSKHRGSRTEERPYCNNCEVFGHWTLDCDDQQTF